MRLIRFCLPVVLVFGSTGSVTSAQAGQTLADKFGALEAVRQMSISPDGTQVAYVGPRASGGQALYIADVVKGGLPKPIIGASRTGERLHWCAWASDTRLVCMMSLVTTDGINLLGFNRMISLDADGNNVARLSPGSNSNSLSIVQNGGTVIDWDVAGKPGSVLMTRSFVPEQTIGSNITKEEQGLAVELVDPRTLKRQIVEKPRRTASEYISDGHGTVRIMGMRDINDSGRIQAQVRYMYRKPSDTEWLPLSNVAMSAVGQTSGFEPYAVDHASNVAYGFDTVNGFMGLYSVALDGTGKRTLVLSRPDADVDSLERIGRDNRVVGASYATERRQVAYFDPALKKLAAALHKALPGQPQIDFIDASAGEAKLLIIASSDTNPGMTYLYTKATGQLAELLPVRPELTGVPMGKMTPVSFPAADGTLIPGYLTLPPGSDGKGLPAIVMPHGGPGSRDEWGFDWLVQFYAARGFAVLQPNYRGSTGYGAAWYQKNGFQSWRTSIGDVNDAGRWLVAQGIGKPDQLAIVGWSYGGYAALQSSVLDPNLFKAIVAIAPVTDLETLREESRNFTNYTLVDRFIGRGAHVREGSPAQNAAAIKAPVLLFHGSQDQNVGIGESRLMASKLRAAGKQVELVEFEDLTHGLIDRTARTRLLADSDAFLRRSLGMAAN